MPSTVYPQVFTNSFHLSLMSHSHNSLMRPLSLSNLRVSSWGLQMPCKERNALLLGPRQQFLQRAVFPVPHLCVTPPSMSMGLGWTGWASWPV